MPDDPNHDPPNAPATEPPAEPASTPASPSHARAFADLFEGEVCRIVRAGEALVPHAWLLARRHPLTRALYPENRYGLFILDLGHLGDPGSEAYFVEALARVRVVAESSAALGVALAFEIRYQSIIAGTEGALEDAVYLVVEHRGLPHPHRRIVFVPPPGQPRDDLDFIDLDTSGDSALPVFANSLKAVPSLLPDLD